MVKSNSAFTCGLKQSLIGISFAGAALAAPGVNAQPGANNGQPNINSVAIYEVQWGPDCSTFAITSSVNDAGNIKDISNIVLACGTDTEGNVTWDKWEFDDGNGYVFGTVLPDGLDPTEGTGCTGAITTAYVKAGSFKSGKGIPGVDSKEFNGHVGGKIDCGDASPPPPPTDG